MTAPTPAVVVEAEDIVHDLIEQLAAPHDGECLCCYVARQLETFDCDGSHRHALRYRDATAPRATALLDRLTEIGACCCDCEMFLNGYVLRAEVGRTRVVVDEDGWECEDDPPQLPLPSCAGVRRGSTQPCREWVRQRRW